MAHSTEPRRRGWWKWYICFILFLATVLCYLDRQTMAVCAPMIKEDFQLNNEQYGSLLAAFRGAYALTQIFAGFLADRMSVRLLYALAVGLWSVAGAAAALVTRFRALAWTRGALGIGEAFNWPCALRVTANTLPPEDRPLANGFFNSGAAVGAMLAPVIIMPIALSFGWRAAFLLIGSIGAAWIFLWLASTRHPGSLQSANQQHSGAEPGQPKPPLTRQIASMLRHPGFWLLMLVAGTINPCYYFIADWIPLYMHDERGFGLFAAAFIATPMFLGIDVGNIGGGGLVKYLAGRGWSIRRARGTAVCIGAALIVPATLAGYVDNAYVCIALLVVAAMGIASVLANYLAALQDISFASVGLIAGVLGGFGNLVSWKLNPLIGKYIDDTGHYYLIFVALGVLPLVGMASLLVFDVLVARRKSVPGNPHSSDET